MEEDGIGRREMDCSKLNAEEIGIAKQMLSYLDEPLRSSEAFRPSVFIAAFTSLMEEYASLDADGREGMWSGLVKAAAFRSYAESLGNADMADALQKVASDMAKMDAKSLDAVVKGGIASLAKLSAAEK